MDVNNNKYKGDLKSCIITTGVSSLNYYKEHIQSFENSNSLIYNYMGAGSIENVAKVDKYKVVIDFCDNNIKEVVFELFNYLLPINGEVHVDLIYDEDRSSEDTEQCLTLLNRLDKYKLIKLEITNRVSQLPKEKEVNNWMKKLKNTFFFTGAGNTGKTSLISSISELCKEKGHTVALIDLTESNKLMNYFTNVYPIIGTNLEEGSVKERIKANLEKAADVYTYHFKSIENATEEKVFTESIKKISSIYDFVFVNTGMDAVYRKSEIFNMGEKIFIVHDFMPTKINSAKQILLKFDECGINTKGNISLIYNKMIKCYFNVGFIEEKMIFKKEGNKRLVPLVDLNCETFEIPYSKKTMKAMINHISHKRSIINNVSYSYRRNIDNIYKYINNIPYVEIGEDDILNYVKNYIHDLLQHSYIKNKKEEAYEYINYVKKCTRSASHLNYARVPEKH